MKRISPIVTWVALATLTLILIACGGGAGSNTSATSTGSNSSPSSTPQASIFVTGEDAPLASVLAFNIALNSVTLNNSSGSVQVISQPQTVDFARFLGARSLLGFNTVPAGTYNSVTVTLASPVISYLSLTSPPSIATLDGTLTTSTVTVGLSQPLVVGSNGLAGLHMDFNLAKSLSVDSTGQLTGMVNPQIEFTVVQSTDEEGEITDLNGGLLSVNVSGNSFVIQRPDGRMLTIDVNSQTQFNSGWSLANMAPPEFISIEGDVQADGSILASEVEVISPTKAFVSGRVVAVNPTSGPVQTVTLYVSEEMPALSTMAIGTIQTIDVSQVTQYEISFFDNWFTNFLFNDTSLIVGQRIYIGGAFDSSSGTFTPSMISLRRQGVAGGLVSNSVNIVNDNQGSFQVQNSGLLGYLLGAPLTIETGNKTTFVNINGLSGLQSAGTANLVVRGLVFKDPTSGMPVMWAHRVKVQQ
jgi:hypothetical protein